MMIVMAFFAEGDEVRGSVRAAVMPSVDVVYL